MRELKKDRSFIPKAGKLSEAHIVFHGNGLQLPKYCYPIFKKYRTFPSSSSLFLPFHWPLIVFFNHTIKIKLLNMETIGFNYFLDPLKAIGNYPNVYACSSDRILYFSRCFNSRCLQYTGTCRSSWHLFFFSFFLQVKKSKKKKQPKKKAKTYTVY
jgi:hypothetical protein